MAYSDLAVGTIYVWETAVQALRKVERRLTHEPFTAEVKRELLEALTAVDDAWEEHIMRVRAWAGV